MFVTFFCPPLVIMFQRKSYSPTTNKNKHDRQTEKKKISATNPVYRVEGGVGFGLDQQTRSNKDEKCFQKQNNSLFCHHRLGISAPIVESNYFISSSSLEENVMEVKKKNKFGNCLSQCSSVEEDVVKRKM